MDTRLEKLNQLLDKHYRIWQETFIDEDTGKEETVERKELLNDELSEEEKALIEEIAADVIKLIDDDLLAFNKAMLCFMYRPFDEIYIELVRRGEEGWASSIEDRKTLEELSDKGNKYASYELYEKYRWGDEKQGIFIDKKLAKKYFDLAEDLPSKYEEEWNDSDDPGAEFPDDFEYVLTGNADTIDGVQKLIYDLCQRYGIPENEEDGLGLFVPQQALMKALVGSASIYYRGNIQYVERENPDRLVITTEADNCDPLLYALRQAYPNLNVEVKEEEW